MNTTNNTKSINNVNKVYNVKEAMEYLKMTNTVYFRKIMGKLGGVKRPHPSMPGIIRWEFTQAELDKYQATRKTVAVRTDGRNRAVIHLTDAEFASIRKNYPEVPLEWQNKGKKHPKAVKKTK